MTKTGYNNTPFILCGHSLGGYLSVQFAHQFPTNISKIVLISPVGVPVKSETYNQDRFEACSSKSKKLKQQTIAYMWDKNVNPMAWFRLTGKYGTQKWLSKKRVLIPSQEEDTQFKEFMHQIVLRPKSSENTATRILSYGAFARLPLYDLFC